MRIAFLADSHFDESSRFDECVRLHDWIADDANSRGCTLLLHGGDLYERRSTPRERLAVANWLRSLQMPTVIVRGNHDALNDLPLLALIGSDSVVLELPSVVRLLPPWLRIACLPWPSRSGLLAGAISREDGEQQIADAMRDVLRGLRSDDPGVTTLFLGHCMVRDSRTSTGQPLVGCDVEVGLDDLALVGADAYLLGHIHMHQQWSISGAPVIYPGSPRRTAFGESEAKGYVVIDVDEHSGLVSWEFVEDPATPMIHVEAHWYTDYITVPGETIEPAGFHGIDEARLDLDGAEIRFRYHVEPKHRQAARMSAELWRRQMDLAGAANVKLEEVVESETRARAPEVAAALTVQSKLRALWASRGETPSDRVLGRLAEIEGDQQ